MAKRRMFSRDITEADAFADMPLSAQALYFHIGMDADDDGFCSSARRIQRTIGASDDDLRLLLGKRFLLPFESGVVVVKHWKINNYLRKDRYTPTVYTDELSLLSVKPNGAYTDAPCLPTGIPSDKNLATEEREGKERSGQESIEESYTPPTLEAVARYVDEQGYTFTAKRFHSYYSAQGWKRKGEPIEDWKALADYWQTTEGKDDNGPSVDWSADYE